MKMQNILIGLGTVACAIASIGTGYTLFGGASYVSPGNASNRAVQLTSNTSNASTEDDFSGIDFGVPAGLTFADIQNYPPTTISRITVAVAALPAFKST